METRSKSDNRTLWIVQMGILLAIIILFAFTPLGYLKVGVIEITLMVIPVAVGAIHLGPLAGAVLGGAFGITSFIQCFGASAFGVFMLSVSPVAAFVTCFIPRVLCGLLPGLLFKALPKRIWSYYLAALLTALLNTVFFVGSVILLFWKNPLFVSQMQDWGVATDTIWLFFVVFVGLNGLIEAVVNFIVAGTVSKLLQKIH